VGVAPLKVGVERLDHRRHTALAVVLLAQPDPVVLPQRWRNGRVAHVAADDRDQPLVELHRARESLGADRRGQRFRAEHEQERVRRRDRRRAPFRASPRRAECPPDRSTLPCPGESATPAASPRRRPCRGAIRHEDVRPRGCGVGRMGLGRARGGRGHRANALASGVSGAKPSPSNRKPLSSVRCLDEPRAAVQGGQRGELATLTPKFSQ
jgi:hypothetical protein